MAGPWVLSGPQAWPEGLGTFGIWFLHFRVNRSGSRSDLYIYLFPNKTMILSLNQSSATSSFFTEELHFTLISIFESFQWPENPYQRLGDSGSLNGSHRIWKPGCYCCVYSTLCMDSFGGFIKGILRGVRYTKSLRVLFLHRRPPSWTSLVLYSRAAQSTYIYKSSIHL